MTSNASAHTPSLMHTGETVLPSNPAVEAVHKSVLGTPEWDVAEDADRLHFYLLLAAQNVGRFEPYTADEVALNTYLTKRMAGKRLCDYAWRILAASRSA